VKPRAGSTRSLPIPERRPKFSLCLLLHRLVVLSPSDVQCLRMPALLFFLLHGPSLPGLLSILFPTSARITITARMRQRQDPERCPAPFPSLFFDPLRAGLGFLTLCWTPWAAWGCPQRRVDLPVGFIAIESRPSRLIPWLLFSVRFLPLSSRPEEKDDFYVGEG